MCPRIGLGTGRFAIQTRTGNAGPGGPIGEEYEREKKALEYRRGVKRPGLWGIKSVVYEEKPHTGESAPGGRGIAVVALSVASVRDGGAVIGVWVGCFRD